MDDDLCTPSRIRASHGLVGGGTLAGAADGRRGEFDFCYRQASRLTGQTGQDLRERTSGADRGWVVRQLLGKVDEV